MRPRNMPAVIILSSLMTASAQNSPTPAVSSGQVAAAEAAPRPVPKQAPAGPDASAAMQRMANVYEQRLREMELSLTKMHAILNDMKAKAAGNNARSSVGQKDNIELWEIMLGHLDRTLLQARMAALQRGQLPSGSAKAPGRVMYRQAPGGQPQGMPAAAPIQTPPQARPE